MSLCLWNRKMNFKLVTCYRRQKYPKINVATKKSVKKKSSGKKKRKRSSNHRHRGKNSYISSNLYSKNFYPANYFFQDDPKSRYFNTRVGVYDQYGYLITRNTPHLTHTRRLPPSSRTLSHAQHHLWKVGNHLTFLSSSFIKFDNNMVGVITKPSIDGDEILNLRGIFSISAKRWDKPDFKSHHK